MLNFKNYLVEQELLNEKLLLINHGKKYGQIVFLAGGTGSGKGFAGTNFMNIQDYKVRDVDETKKTFLKINKLKHKYPELDGLDLKKPADVAKLHKFIEDRNISDKTLDNMVNSMKNPETLPNILFDVTLKNVSKIDKSLKGLLEVGYKPENIHLVWVLTNYDIAFKANKERGRVVPYGEDGTPNIFLDTHEGASKTMWNIVGKGNVPKLVNGGIYVILNNRDQTVVFKEGDKKDYRSAPDNKNSPVRKTTGATKSVIIKNFTYLTYKEPNKSPKKDKDIYNQLFNWVTNNIPKSALKFIE